MVFRTLGLRRPGVSSIIGVLLILAFTSHVSYLTFVSFDYGYNMLANATIGELRTCTWGLAAIGNPAVARMVFNLTFTAKIVIDLIFL